MPQRVHLRARLTREGWYYLAVLLFIVAGAALTHVNLLVVLGGLMLAPLLINWRLAQANVRGLRVRRLPLHAAPAGEVQIVEFAITNPRRWFAAWLIVVEDHWDFADQPKVRAARSLVEWLQRGLAWLLSSSADTAAPAVTMCIAPGETARARYDLLVPRRGRYITKVLRWRSCFPLGLVEASVTVAQRAELIALPRIGRLSAEWTEMVVGVLAGEGARPQRERANEGDFFAVRPWQSGDSTRWMHWRTTARAGRPMVRQFEREASPTFAIVLDPYLPEGASAGELARCEAAISFVATALADLAQRDVAHLAVLVATRDLPLWLGARAPLFVEQVMTQLAELQGNPANGLAEAKSKLAEELPDAACILVVSSRPVENNATTADEFEHTIRVGSQEFGSLYALE